MKNRKPLFLVRCCALAWLLQSLATAPAFALCTPAPDPDLDNDGRVTLADVNFVARQFGLVASDPRFNETADSNCDGIVDKTDLVYVKSAFGKTFPIPPTTSLAVLVSASDSTFDFGTQLNFTATVDFTSSSTTAPFTVNLSQTVDPPGGLTLNPPLQGQVLHYTASAKTDFAQTVGAGRAGSYTITTTASVAETGQNQTVLTKVTVKPSVDPEETKLHLQNVRRSDPLPLGDAEDWTVDFGFSPQDKTKPYTVRFEQTITPPVGLDFKPALEGKVLDVTGGRHEYLRQEFVTTQEGDYDVITTATVVETGYSLSVRNAVRVALAGSPNLSIVGPVLVDHWAFPPDLITDVDAWVDILGKDGDKVEGVAVEERRTGRHWNFTGDPGDPKGAFRGKIRIDTQGMAPDDCFSFRAIIHTSKGDAPSDYRDYCVTGLPLKFTHITEEIRSGFTAPDGTDVAKDLINITFKPGVPESRIRAIVAAHGGIIIGARPEDKAVQIRLVPAPAAFAELLAIAHRISEEPEVRWMDLTYFAFKLLSLQTSDPDRVLQTHLKSIRADEAWYLERGQDQTIAVLDTGIDLRHPDLAPKLLLNDKGVFEGYDFGDDDFFPSDPQGHGTHVAGIAAAATNNALGIAGIGWETKILPIKLISDNLVPIIGTADIEGEDVVSALRYLAAFDDVKIVNMSFGASEKELNRFCQWLAEAGWISYQSCDLHDLTGTDAEKFRAYKRDVCQAVEQSHLIDNKFLVAAAGNIGQDERHYPAACAGAVAVAAVDDNDNKAPFSEYGDWIAIAAPGVDIYSTYPSSAPPGCTPPKCDYGMNFGTSQAAPMIAGAAALLLSQDTELKPDEILDRLQQTAKKLTGPYALGAGLLDVFGALFNPSFEADTLEGWEHFTCVPNTRIDSDRTNESECTQTAGSGVLKAILGGGFDIDKPTHGKQMAHLTTLPELTKNKVKLRRRFKVQSDVTTIPIQFDYAIISDAYTEAFGFHLPDDRLLITFESGSESSGSFVVDFVDPLVDIDLSKESASNWRRIFDYSIPGGDRSIGWTKWRTKTTDLVIIDDTAEFVIRLDDVNNAFNDTEVIIDNIRFRLPSP